MVQVSATHMVSICRYLHVVLLSLALTKSHQNVQGNSQGQLKACNNIAQCKISQAIHIILNGNLHI